MITQPARHHNRTALVLALGLFLAAGCGGGGGDDQAQTAAGTVHVAGSCPMVTTDHVLAAFLDAVDRGDAVTLEDCIALADGPVWSRWRRSFEPEVPSAEVVGRTLFVTLRGEEFLSKQLQTKKILNDLEVNYRVSREHRARIRRFVDTAIADDFGCAVRANLDGWVPADALPETLRFDFVVSHPEIRFYEDRFMIDGGMAWAAGQDQLGRFLASVVYKDTATIDGDGPGDAEGADILLQCLRIVRNEAVPAYLDNLPEVTFDPRHQLLKNASPVPEELCGQATRTLRTLDRNLSFVRAKDAPTRDDWLSLYRLFVGAQSWQPTGWYMARVIADNLGVERLQESSRTVPDFWSTYQEAAALMPETPTADRGMIEWHLQSAPSFSDDNAAWIDRELRRLFP